MLVTELDLDSRDFVIFGSGPLLSPTGCVTTSTTWTSWPAARRGGASPVMAAQGPEATTVPAPPALFWDGLIQFSQGWISADWHADDLIDWAETIRGWPFARLTDVLAYKQALLRPKDYPDIAVLHQTLRHGG